METMHNTSGTGTTSSIKETADRIIDGVSKVIVGKEEVTRLTLTALLCEGNVLLEDVPGVGKTMLARAIARALGCSFHRIQCTPDLLPSDVTGIQFYNQKSGNFEFRPGPIMTNIVLVDEINRATPRTQSSLLEAMQEQQITVDMETIKLPRPFLLIATQNPIELEGTFPLPEAQLDRFMLRLRLGYPSEIEEGKILHLYREGNPMESLESITGIAELVELQKICRGIYVDESVRGYIVSLIRATREHPDIKLGASPRAALGLNHAAQAWAAMQGRSFVTPDDVKFLAVPALSHRIIVKAEARLKGHLTEELVRELLDKVPVPVEDKK
ncbi:MAG: MoxR family ATPase [Dehalococcoidales bacterium]|nr:MoxR family ATPase [Dehalococcoidales bacterium]